MAEEIEHLYEYEDAEEGDAAPSMEFHITSDAISLYADAVRNPNPTYQRPREAQIAPPTMVYTFAPMRRGAVINTKGYVAPEQSKLNPRSTPFVNSHIQFFQPVHTGDVISSISQVGEKYERRGNQFISFYITATNQRGEKVAQYTYTCLWRYGKNRPQS